MAWSEELKAQALEMYTEGNPTPENSTELIKEIAKDLEQSANGVRMVLVQAGVYVKKEAATATAKGTTAKDGAAAKSPRVSKETSIAALVAEIEKQGKLVDEEIINKLTGKAAIYLLSILKVTADNSEDSEDI